MPSLLRICRRLFLFLVVAGQVWPHYAVAAANEPVVKRFDVRQFGAKPDGSGDAQPAIELAVDAARKWTDEAPAGARHAIVFFPRGTYALSTVRTPYAINLDHLHDVSLEGEDCRDSNGMYCVKLIGAPWHFDPHTMTAAGNGYVSVYDSEHVQVRNFYFDRRKPYFTQGIVVGVDPSQRMMELRFDDGFADFTDPVIEYVYKTIDVITDPASGSYDHSQAACVGDLSLPAGVAPCFGFHIVRHERQPSGTWRVWLDRAPPSEFAHHAFYMWRNTGWPKAVFVEASADVTVENIFYTGGGGSAAHLQANDGDITIRHFDIDVPPGSNRLFAATSGFNGSRNRGNVTLDHVSMAHTDDDGFHFNEENYFPALEQNADRTTVRVDLCNDRDFRPGDRVGAWDWKEKREIARATVVSANVVMDAHHDRYPSTCDIHLDRPLPPLSDMRTYDNSRLGRLNDTNARIVNLSVRSFLTVTNSHLSSTRARCGIIQTPALIAHNTCTAVLAGLLVGPEFSWGEGYAVDGVKIVDNRFTNISGTAIYIADIEDSNHSPTYKQLVSTHSPKSNDARDNKNITIEGNTFSQLGRFGYGIMGIRGLAISVENAENVVIRDNRFDLVPPFHRDAPSPVIVSPTTTANVQVQSLGESN
jgi:hypothetical protein